MSKRSGVTVKTLQLREAQLSILDMVIPLLWLCDVDCVYSTVAQSSVGDASLQSMTIDIVLRGLPTQIGDVLVDGDCLSAQSSAAARPVESEGRHSPSKVRSPAPEH